MAEADILYQTDLAQRLQIAIVPLVVLLLLYYGYSYLAYETTIKRSLYEVLAGLFPASLWRLLQQLVSRISGLPQNVGGGSEEVQSKSEDLQSIYSGQGIPSVMQRARSLSGFDKFINPAVEISFPGLGNWDNSCFQNSILQGLASLSAFSSFVERDFRTCRSVGVDAPALEGLQNFLGQLKESIQGRRTIWPPSVLRSMNTWQQQDAQEYLSTILDSIEKEVTRTQKTVARRANPGLSCLRSEAFHPPQQIVGGSNPAPSIQGQDVAKPWLPPSSLEGFLSQKLRCQTCGYSEGVSLTSFNCLTLNLGTGGNCYLESLLDAYFEPESIDGVECDECTRLANQQQATVQPEHFPAAVVPDKAPKVLSTKAKHILISRLPPNLAIHINRSIFDDWGNQRKNNSLIEFPARLKIWGDWVENFGVEDTEIHAIYELRCIITHSGRHDNGHYVARGKRGKDWFLFNDETVTPTTESDVLARGNVFMLFYEKLDCDLILEVSTPDSTASQAGSPTLRDHADDSAEQETAPVFCLSPNVTSEQTEPVND